ncbi:MAG: beta strand repeat-containing protein, partial [Gammaproteobacteria bacterium]
NAIQVSDIGNDNNLQSVTLTVANGKLNLANLTSSGVTTTAGANNATTITFYGAISQINNALNDLSYTAVNGKLDTLTITTNDVINSSGTIIVSSPKTSSMINIVATTPVISGFDTVSANTYISGSSPVYINRHVMVSDTNVDTAGNQANSGYYNFSVTVSRLGGANSQDVFSLNLPSNIGSGNYILGTNTPTGINLGNGLLQFSVTNGVATIYFGNYNGWASGTVINAVIQSLQYSNSSLAPPSAVNLQYTFNDGRGISGVATAYTTVNITQVDHAPTITAPASITFNENASFIVSGTNTLAITDVDSNNGKELVTLTATNGTIDLGTTNGITITGGSNGTATVTFTGTVTQINSALANLMFSPTLGYKGNASLSMLVNDQGNTGTGGPLTASSTVSIIVNQVAATIGSAPTISNLDQTVSTNVYVAGSTTPVTINSRAVISDLLDDPLNLNLGNYSNTQLTIDRSSGLNNQDLFSFAAMKDVVVNSNTLVSGGN